MSLELDEETLDALINAPQWSALEHALSVASAAGVTKRHNRREWLKQPHVRKAMRERVRLWAKTESGRLSREKSTRKYVAKSEVKAKRAGYERNRKARLRKGSR